MQLQSSLITLLSKQLVKFRTRLAAANRANLSIHMKIIYFNTFSLSLFHYSQTQRFFSPKLLKPLYHAMANFLLQRHWFPQHLLVGLCRWLRLGVCLTQLLCGRFPSLDAVCFAEEQVGSCATHRSSNAGNIGSIQRLLALLRQNNTPAQRASGFKFKQLAIDKLLAASHGHLAARICKNGCAIVFLDWLADLPTTQVCQ